MDKYFTTTGKLIGPLHGIPVTLKDQFNVKGVDSSIGYVSRAFQPAEEDAILVKTLKNLGAIIIAKTNLPQSIMVHLPVLSASNSKLTLHSGARLNARCGD